MLLAMKCNMFCDLAINIYVIVILKATLAIVLLRIIKKRKKEKDVTIVHVPI